MFGLLQHWRRKRILARPFPDPWQRMLEESWPLYRKLPEPLAARLRQCILIFLEEKVFEGCQGFQITDEVRVQIAAQACLLIAGRKTDYYPDLRTILVYPDDFRTTDQERSPAGVVHETNMQTLGQSWDLGVVILSWQSSKRGAANMRDGRNVVIHEFAHQLDQAFGAADGAPDLGSRGRYRAWQRVFSREYERLQDSVERGRRTVLDEYGASNPAEFFAVASECFFEKPRQLKERRPELYQELQLFYGQDPCAYHRRG